MRTILPTYIPLLLLFTIIFSSKFDENEIQKSFLKHEIVPLNFQLNPLRLNDFLIYLSNDKFKNIILPYLSSEHLLKIYFHFRNLYPNVSIEKFLPDATKKRTVLDLQKSYFAYIFQNEFSFFNPIIVYSEQNYKTTTLGKQQKKIHRVTKDSWRYVKPTKLKKKIYGLFPSNKIFFLESHGLDDYQEVFVALDKSDYSYFVAKVTDKPEKLKAIAHGTLDKGLSFHYHLQCIWLAYDANCFTKLFFKAVNLDDKYITCLYKSRLGVFILEILGKKCPLTMFTFLYHIFRFAFLCFCFFPIYHAKMAPFYLLSIPFEYSLFQHQNVILNGIITKHFVYFWTLPASFGSFWYFLRVILVHENYRFQIQPDYLRQTVQYQYTWKGIGCTQERIHIEKWEYVVYFFCSALYHFLFGFIYSLPFSPFMMIYGEANE